jgi:16S rRNA G1207 methylase RsmC
VGLLGSVISHLCDRITLTDHHKSVLNAARHTLHINSVSNGNVSVLNWSDESSSFDDVYDVIVAAGNDYFDSF